MHPLYGPPIRPVYAPPSNHRQHGRGHAAGFGAPYFAYPGVVAGEAQAPAVAASPAVTHSYVWYGPRPIGQGDAGYVTRPAIYDVQQELARYRRPSSRGPVK